MIRLDIDEYDELSLLKLLFSLRPCQVRISASGKGLHVKKEGDADYTSWVYTIWDDPKRLELNIARAKAGVSHNVLWDIKQGKHTSEWVNIITPLDAVHFFERLYPP